MLRYFALLFSMAAMTPALAQSPDLTAIAGKAMKVNRAMAMNPDCSSTGNPEYRIFRGPQHGTLSVRKGKDFPRYPESNPRHVCNTRASSAVQLWYTATRGYTGGDEFAFMIIYPGGNTEQKTVRVNVMP
jgi:hypothetical protein